MDSGSREKVLTPLTEIKLFFKNWILFNLNRGFCNRNKSRKITFCLGKIVFLYSEVFASGNHY